VSAAIATSLGGIAAVVLAASPARADDDARPWHGSVRGGGSLLVTGARGDRLRVDVALDLKPRSRYGVSLAWRAIEPRGDDKRAGLAIAGLVFEAAAARPRLVIDLHADAGVDLDLHRPLAGGGIRTTLTIAKPLVAVLDTGAYMIVDGVDGSRLQLQSSLAIGVAW